MIDISSVAFICSNFENQGVKAPTHAVVGPIRIVEGYDAENRPMSIIFNGCNLYRYCESPFCGYSELAHQEGKKIKEQRLKSRVTTLPSLDGSF